MKYKVVYETEVDADSPLEAAKEVENIFKEICSCPPQLYVQENSSGKVFSVDLAEEDEDAVLPVVKYIPMINN